MSLSVYLLNCLRCATDHAAPGSCSSNAVRKNAATATEKKKKEEAPKQMYVLRLIDLSTAWAALTVVLQ